MTKTTLIYEILILPLDDHPLDSKLKLAPYFTSTLLTYLSKQKNVVLTLAKACKVLILFYCGMEVSSKLK